MLKTFSIKRGFIKLRTGGNGYMEYYGFLYILKNGGKPVKNGDFLV
jgi:hypothetical protein